MSADKRKNRIKELETKIISMCLVAGNDKKKRDQLIEPLSTEILEISKIQEANNELPNQIYWQNKQTDV